MCSLIENIPLMLQQRPKAVFLATQSAGSMVKQAAVLYWSSQSQVSKQL